ncbi:MAG: cation:dicarboxylase symporter family transporter [bacterium]
MKDQSVDGNIIKSKPVMSRSAQMMLALAMGIAVGLFFGEMVGWMSIIGNTVILLMQMTVYPYIVVSLIGGIGKLTKEDASMLFRQAGVIMLLLWLLGLAVVFLMPVVFPQLESASFFSTSSIAEPIQVDYYKLYIPSNPFQSMAEGSVPAMVLFCIALGLALIGMNNKSEIINFMDVASTGLSRVTDGLLKVLPFGIFAMSASAAGTMGVEEFASMQVYLVSMFVLCMLLTFWVLPWVVAVLTPVPYKDVLRVTRAALVTAFATGNIFIILPVVTEECKRVLAERETINDEARSMIDILVPIAYSFPNIGKFTVILFVMFAGWFSGKPVEAELLPSLAVSGLLSLFGDVYVAIPFMLDLVHLPSDLFQFFVMSGFLTGKVSSMVAVMNLFVLTLLAISLFLGKVKISVTRILRLGIGLGVVVTAVLMVTRVGLDYVIDQDKQTDEVIANMQVAEQVPTRVLRQFKNDNDEQRPIASLAEVKKRGVLRVGYRPSNVPFSYYNNFGDLVGFDVEIANRLAEDMGVVIEFVPFRRGKYEIGLDRGFFDVAMSGLLINADMMQRVGFSTPVMELTRSLVLADHRVKDFDSVEEILNTEPIVVAYVEDDALIARFRLVFPQMKFVAIENYKLFFKQKSGTYDALMISAEAGSAWTLFYPDYGVAVYDRKARYPTGYAVSWENADLLRYVDSWVGLRKVDGTFDKTYKTWILGQVDGEAVSRWSVVRDVLGWVE